MNPAQIFKVRHLSFTIMYSVYVDALYRTLQHFDLNKNSKTPELFMSTHRLCLWPYIYNHITNIFQID